MLENLAENAEMTEITFWVAGLMFFVFICCCCARPGSACCKLFRPKEAANALNIEKNF